MDLWLQPQNLQMQEMPSFPEKVSFILISSAGQEGARPLFPLSMMFVDFGSRSESIAIEIKGSLIRNIYTPRTTKLLGGILVSLVTVVEMVFFYFCVLLGDFL